MRYFILMLIATVATACAPIVDVRGHGVREADTKQIVEGMSTREDIAALLGSPSTTSTFGPEAWYYITTTKERSGLFVPEVVKQNVFAVRFNEAGTVKDFGRYHLKDGRPVEIVEKTTPTEGHSLGVLEQLLGNIGRFNSPGRQPGTAGGMGGPGGMGR